MLLPLVASADVCALQNEEKEPYAVLSEDNTVLTFYYDDQKAARNGMGVGPFTESYDKDRQRFIVNTGWYAQRESIISVVFDASFAGCTTLTSTAYWFYNLENLSSIIGISNLKTDNVTDMQEMFLSCSSLTSLDVTGFKTDNVTNMSGMFSGCHSLTSLDVTGFKTDNVTDMENMFHNCRRLKSLDVSNFKTDNVTDMSSMFTGCSGLKSLDVSGFKTDNVTRISGMFNSCAGLTSLDVSNFKTDNVTDLDGMFSICFRLTSLDLSNFKTDKVMGMNRMFEGSYSLQTIYTGDGWSTAKVQLSEKMFEGCTSLVGGAGTTYSADHTDHTYAHIDGGTDNPGYFTDKNATPSTGGDPEPEPEPYAVLSEDNTVLTFYYDDQKAARNGMGVGPFTSSYDKDRQRSNINSGWDEQRESITSVVFDESFANCTTLTSTACWFYGLQNLSSITGISNLKTDKVTDMCFMFYGCSGLTSLDVSGFKTDKVTNMRGLFEGCSSLTSLDVTGFKTDNVRNMSIMFSGCSGLTNLDVRGFKTDKVGVMRGMFNGCSGLTSLDVTGFKTDEVGDMGFMFSGCSGLTSLDLSNFKIDNVKYIDQMFRGCSGLTSLDVTGFKTDNLTDMIYMFRDCSGLTSLDVTGFKTDNVTRMCGMFYGCSSLTSLDVTGFKTDKVTDMSNMFRDCSSLTSLDVTGFRTDNVKDMYCMFQDSSGLKTIYAGEGWSTAEVTAGKDMFKGCTSLVGGTGTRYDESHTGYNYARIDGGASNPGYFTSKGGESPAEETEETITISSAGQTTWCSAYDLDFTGVEGIKAYTAGGYDRVSGTIWLMRVKQVPANEGILIMGTSGEYHVPHKSTGTYYANLMVGTLQPITINETDGEYTNYYLSNGDSGVGFYKVNGSVDLKANRAYLPLLKGTASAGTRFIGIEFEDDGTTSIKEVKSEGVKSEEWYTLQGQRVAKPGKGLYIRNGKMVIVR